MNPRDFVEIKYGQWWEQVSQKATKTKHARNIRDCLGAVDYHNQKKRPLNVLLIHGSGRSSFSSAAQDPSNSQLLLRSAVEPFRGNPAYEITEIALREYNVEPCEGCYSTSSALCGFPCNCFPWDPMQELYPLVLKCDVMLCSTGVNQSAMSTRLKTFLDRLISLDGGFFVGADQYEQKGPEWRDKCIALGARLSSTGQLHYDARMWGRVAAYFITSKDEELCHDKQYFSSHPKFLKRAKIVVKAAIHLAQKLRMNPIPFDGGARTNRT